MSLNLSNPELNSFLRNIQFVWRKNNSNEIEPGEQHVHGFDISPIEASISRLIAAQERKDTSTFLREWAAFLAPNGHLASASNTQIGTQIMAMVRERASGVGLMDMAGSIVVLDPVRVGGKKEVQDASNVAETKVIEGAAQHGGQGASASEDAGWVDVGTGAVVTSGEPAQPEGGW